MIGVSSATDELRIVLEPNQRVTFPAAGAAGCRPNIIAAGDALMRRRKQASGARGFEQACGKTKHDTNESSTHLGHVSETENAPVSSCSGHSTVYYFVQCLAAVASCMKV